MQAGQPITFDGSAADRKIIDVNEITTTGGLSIGGQTNLELKTNGTPAFSIDSNQNATFSGPTLTINADVDIQGTLNTISSTEVAFDDSTLLLNSNKSGTAVDSDPDAGLVVNRGANTNVSFLWNETADQWVSSESLAMSNKKITGVADPTSNQDAATKIYVDNKVSPFLPKDGSVEMTGNLDMNSLNKIVNVLNPENDQDAATKKYVDDANTAMTSYVASQIGGVDLSTCAIKSTVNEFTAEQNISVNSSNPALKITQEGAGSALEVHDKASDTTFFKVDEEGYVTTGGSIFVRPVIPTGDASLEVGSGRTADGNAYIDLIGDTTNTDYALRLIRKAGENGVSELKHKGTGSLTISSEDGAEINTNLNGVTKFQITDSQTIVFNDLNIVGVNAWVDGNPILHAGNLPVTATKDGSDTVYTFNALA